MNRGHFCALAASITMILGATAAAQQERDQRQTEERSQAQGQTGAYESFPSSEHGQQAAEEMDRLDTNRDSRIDESEAQADPELIAAWADVDLSRDGSVDATEYYLYAAQRRIGELELETGQAPGAQSGRQPGQAGQAGQYPAFEEIDRDSDGQLSRTELAAVEGVDFSNADANQDGNVSRQEYMQAQQGQQQPGQGRQPGQQQQTDQPGQQQQTDQPGQQRQTDQPGQAQQPDQQPGRQPGQSPEQQDRETQPGQEEQGRFQ